MIRSGDRIDILGNANNYPLILTRALRELGYDAHLHLTMPGALNSPENLFQEYAFSYPAWIHDWREFQGPLSFDWGMLRQVWKAIERAKALILNYDAVSLGAFEARPYFCLLTGTDLLTFASPLALNDMINRYSEEERENIYTSRHIRKWAEFCMRQRSAIRSACGYSFFPEGQVPDGDATLASLGADPALRTSILMTSPAPADFSLPAYNGDRPLNILMSARLTWDKDALPACTQQAYKGNDKFLRALAAFIEQGGAATLTMFRKGAHVEQTEALVSSLHLEGHINWRDEISQQEFLKAVREADIIVDSISEAHIGMAAIDSMALGRPVIASAPDAASWGWSRPIPICHAQSEADIMERLKELASNPERHREIAVSGREFVHEFFSPASGARKVADSLNGREPDTSELLLHKALSDCYAREAEFIKKSRSAK